MILVFVCLHIWLGMGFWGAVASSLWVWSLWDLFERVDRKIAFKEFILVLYGLNYLFSPAISYLISQKGPYRMKLPEQDYFLLAIPCMLLLQFGMNFFKTNVFNFDFKTVKLQSKLNQTVLLEWLYVGFALRLIKDFIPVELGFFVYLLSGVRFIAAYGLLTMDAAKYKWHFGGLMLVELLLALQQGMFHDFVMWVIFFVLYWFYIKKPGQNIKILLGLSTILAIYFIQITKSEYRTGLKSGDSEAGLSSFQDALEKNSTGEEGVFNKTNATNSLTRVNQAWIFASTANRMNQIRDFQGLAIMNTYLKAALLPRFLAPNKLIAGEKATFNKFSGHRIGSETSMGLGFFADGYIAFGPVGSYAFAFLLGLIFSLIFKFVENWSQVSPFFILLMFPILHYAVRPDCETQVIMGHVVKGLFVYGCLSVYYAGLFTRKARQTQLAQEKAAVHANRKQKIYLKRIEPKNL